MPEELDAKEWRDWLEEPCTKHLLETLKGSHHNVLLSMQSYTTTGEHLCMQYYSDRGMLSLVNQLLELMQFTWVTPSEKKGESE